MRSRSRTRYELTSSPLADNPINRSLINSPMLDGRATDPDGGYTLYIQNASPGPEKIPIGAARTAGTVRPGRATVLAQTRSTRRPGTGWSTPPVLATAGLVLAATFSALAVIPLLFLVQHAVIVAGGVLIDTFVGSLPVPGVIHDIGRGVARRVAREDDGGGQPVERPLPDCASVPAHPD